MKKEFYYHNAATCDFQQCDILTSVASFEPVQPPFKLRNSKCCSVSRTFKRQAKALIRQPLLVAHTTLLEISCRGSYNLNIKINVTPHMV